MKKMMQLVFVFLANLAFVNVYAANQVFDDIDTDKDGYISKSEAEANKSIQSNWDKVDRDMNGKVDISEFSAFEGEGMFQPPELEEPEPGAAPMDK